jgi:hypothetical protein
LVDEEERAAERDEEDRVREHLKTMGHARPEQAVPRRLLAEVEE